MSWHMVPRYGHVIHFSGYPVLTTVKPYCECPVTIKDVDLPRHAWDTPPFLLTVSPTPPVQSVDAYVRSVNHVTTKRKEVDQVGRLRAPLWFQSKFYRSMGLCQNVEMYFLMDCAWRIVLWCWEFTRAYVLFRLHLISESIYSTRSRIFIIQLSLL